MVTKVLLGIITVLLALCHSRHIEKYDGVEYLFDDDVIDEGSGTTYLKLCHDDGDCNGFKCINGECVLIESKRCPETMEYVECLTRCDKLCQSAHSSASCREHAYCKEGCECIEGFYWLSEKGVCVSKQDCEKFVANELAEAAEISSKCPPYSVYQACPNKCPPKTCENIGKPCNNPPKGCAPKQCVCRNGFVQASDNIADGCISEYECEIIFTSTASSIAEFDLNEQPGNLVELVESREVQPGECPVHSQLKDCVPLTPVNCYTLFTNNSPAECGHQRCECDDGYVRADTGDEASCIPVNACHNIPLVP